MKMKNLLDEFPQKKSLNLNKVSDFLFLLLPTKRCAGLSVYFIIKETTPFFKRIKIHEQEKFYTMEQLSKYQFITDIMKEIREELPKKFSLLKFYIYSPIYPYSEIVFFENEEQAKYLKNDMKQIKRLIQKNDFN